MDHWAYQILLEYHWAFGPLLYCYVRSFLDPGFRLKGRMGWIFLPVLLQTAFSLWVKIQNLYWQGSPDDLPFLGSESYQLWMHTPFQYLILSGLLLFFSFRAMLHISKASLRALNPTQQNSLNWLKLIIRGYQVFSLLTILVTLADFLFFDYAFEPFYPFPVFISLAGLTYWLALSGYAHREASLPPPPPATGSLNPDGEWVSLMDRIENYMDEERPYLNPDLNLSKLADSLQLKNYQITQALNRVRKQTFSQYINTYRVEEAQKLLGSSEYDHFTLLAIGYEAGFNSKASFNRVFKAISGLSPSAYKNQATGSDRGG